jgi:HlyD family secretion protein
MTIEAGSQDERLESAPKAPVEDKPMRPRRVAVSPAAVIVAMIIAAIVGLSGWYPVQPRPRVVQGEADSTRIDMAVRVDGRVGEIPVVLRENVAAGTPLVRIENPALLAKLQEERASKAVGDYDLNTFRVRAGRPGPVKLDPGATVWLLPSARSVAP